MSPKQQSKAKFSMSDLLQQYEKIFQKPSTEEQLPQPDLNNEKIAEAPKQDFLPLSVNSQSLIAMNNKDNPQISIFDAYAFNEVLRRYENSIVQITKQEIQLKDSTEIAKKYDEQIDEIKDFYETKLSEYDDIADKEKNLREIIDQVNVVLDEKDEQILEYRESIDDKDYQLSLLKKEIQEKEHALHNMEAQLYSVLFKISESSSLV